MSIGAALSPHFDVALAFARTAVRRSAAGPHLRWYIVCVDDAKRCAFAGGVIHTAMWAEPVFSFSDIMFPS